MKNIFESILKHPIATGILVGTVSAGIARVVRAVTDYKKVVA